MRGTFYPQKDGEGWAVHEHGRPEMVCYFGGPTAQETAAREAHRLNTEYQTGAEYENGHFVQLRAERDALIEALTYLGWAPITGSGGVGLAFMCTRCCTGVRCEDDCSLVARERCENCGGYGTLGAIQRQQERALADLSTKGEA